MISLCSLLRLEVNVLFLGRRVLAGTSAPYIAFEKEEIGKVKLTLSKFLQNHQGLRLVDYIYPDKQIADLNRSETMESVPAVTFGYDYGNVEVLTTNLSSLSTDDSAR